MKITIHYSASKKSLKIGEDNRTTQTWDLTKLDHDQEAGISEHLVDHLIARKYFQGVPR